MALTSDLTSDGTGNGMSRPVQDPSLQDVWRQEAPHVLGALLRRYGGLPGAFGDCEDAVQEALAAATEQWPRDGLPDNPRGWLLTVASRRLVDAMRSQQARRAREDRLVAEPDGGSPSDADDSLLLLVLCCHPALTRPSQVALTLRAVGGLSTAQIAAAFLVPEATMAQRISRAKAALRSAGAQFTMPSAQEWPSRVAAVLDVLYLVFNEGYTTSGGTALVDLSLADEAIRLTRQLHALLPDHDEVSGLLALLLLTAARTAARVDAAGDLVPLAEQDRTRWDRTTIAEGVAILEQVLPRGHVGAYQLQAAIAAVHAEAGTWPETDWTQIAVLYGMLAAAAPGPAVTLNCAVAQGMAYGTDAGLAVLAPLFDDPAMRRHHRAFAVRAHLLEQAGRYDEALEDYARAAALTSSIPEQRYLNRRRAALLAWHDVGDEQEPRL